MSRVFCAQGTATLPRSRTFNCLRCLLGILAIVCGGGFTLTIAMHAPSRKFPLMVTDSKLEFSGKLKPGGCYEEIMIH
jgi:hypothetical protein